MERVRFASLDREVSRIGFGCASLGSRVAPKQGLSALERAYDAGVTWFDVAPSYGDGEAEILLGQFLSGKRKNVQICTKVGIDARRASSFLRRAKPLARHVVKVAPAMRKYAVLAGVPASKQRITPELIKDSAERSLSRLRIDYIDVLALHDASIEEASDPALAEALSNLIASGKVAAAAMASTVEVDTAGLVTNEIFRVLQYANNPRSPGRRMINATPVCRDTDQITHSVFGTGDLLKSLEARIRSSGRGMSRCLDEEGYGGSARNVARALLADYALKTNETGVTLLSMFEHEHLAFNIARLAGIKRVGDVCRLLRNLGLLENGAHP